MIKRLEGVFVLCVLLSAVTAQAFAQQPVKLQYKFMPNQLLRYKIGLNATTSIQGGPSDGGSIPITMSGVLRQRVKQVLSNGDAEVAVAYESLNMEAMGNAFPTDVSKMPVVTMVISPSGAIKKTEGLDKMSGSMGAGGQFANMGNFVTNAALPLTPVKVGDKWAQDMVFPALGKFKLQCQLSAADDKAATIKQSVSGDIDASGIMPPSASGLKPKGTISVDDTLVFSTADGRIVRSQGTGNATMAINIPNGGGTMNIVTRFDVTMQLLVDK